MSARAPRLPLRFAVVTIVSLLLLELTLQVLALFVAWSNEAPAIGSTAAGDRLVLCVGDSFTWGQGASAEGSYPSQLADLLTDATDAHWVVANRGKPGRNSAQAVRVIDDALRASQPAVVCLMVGVNDQWSRPERVELAVAAEGAVSTPPDGFRWEFRTLRMLQIMFGGQDLFASELEAVPTPEAKTDEPVAEEPAPEPAAPVPSPPASDPGVMPTPDDPMVGRWRLAANREIAWFKPNGTVQLGKTVLPWRRVDDRVRMGDVTAPTCAVEIGDARVVLRPDGAPPIELVADREPRPWMFHHAVRDKSWREVLELGSALEGAASDVEDLGWQYSLHRGMVLAAFELGDRDRATAQLDELAAVAERSDAPKYVVGTAYVANRIGDEQRAFEIARDGVTRFPSDLALWNCYAAFVGVALDREAAAAELRRG
ncbi:MAG: SGNH/GDSL hydrolase family protein, partial [Planctomycetes bacterium]|nr:SGNH/GDSL hydrolase family protein [Planctomycetota bacterium]